MAELLAEQGDMDGALHWATAGADECKRRGDTAELRLLLSLRYRIRHDLGMPEDDYDQLLDELTTDTRKSSTSGRRSRRRPGDNRPLVAASGHRGQRWVATSAAVRRVSVSVLSSVSTTTWSPSAI